MHTFGIPTKLVITGFGVLLLLGLFLPSSVFAQQAIIQGSITDAQTGQALAGANILIQGTTLGAAADVDGNYRIPVSAAQVTNAEVTIVARFVGYRAGTHTMVLSPGTHTVNFLLRQDFLRLDDIVVTGLVGEMERARLPFTVARLTEQDFQVSNHISAANIIQGKVAGATVVQGSGRPGSAPSFLLRGPTSIDASGRDQDPMYIVDGVILLRSMVDIDALDIESVEVIKGAAAASLYGSRAANGVIQITTRRGHRQPDNQVRYTVRTEVGRSDLPGRFDLAQRHEYAMTPDGTQFVSGDGTPCAFLDCPNIPLAGQWRNPQLPEGHQMRGASIWSTTLENEWPTTYDHVALFFDPGMSIQNYVAAEGRSGRTNFQASLSHLREDGVMPGLEGFERFNFRLNIDQSVAPNLTASGTALISRATDDLFPEHQGNPLFTLTRMPAGVDLNTRDADGDYLIRPDPRKENANPLYELHNRQYERSRNRILGSMNFRYTPTTWMFLETDVSYDRLNLTDEDFYNKGYKTARPSTVNSGHVYKYTDAHEALNSSVTATFHQTFGALSNRTQVRYIYEDQQWNYNSGWGYNLGAANLPTLHNVGGTPDVRSQQGAIKASGYFLITNFDYDGRYIFDALVRRDGSSLFGEDERWQMYFRLAGAWRITEEPWFNINGLNELKLRYSYGTAGGRPAFVAQYETYNVLRGVVSPQTLGNRQLKPELAAEHEMGIEIGFLERFSLDITYAQTEVQDQILRVPLAAYTGFVTQWRNAGTLKSNTLEASLNAQIIRTRDYNLSARVLFDRTRQNISELFVPDFTYGISGQAFAAAFYARPGERLGTFYGYKWSTECSQLPESVQSFCGTHFQTNDDGYLVYVGEGNSWQDGMSSYLWGTSGSVGGVSYNWGVPIIAREPDPVTGELTTFLPIGNTQPDYHLSFSMNFNFKNLSLYALLDAEQGFDVWNQPLQWATFENYSGVMDQSGKPDERKKPLGYYSTLYNSLAPSNTHWVEDGSYVKLREVAVRYRFGRAELNSVGLGVFQGITLSVSGRNLKTWTNYNGYDPEVGRAGGDVGSAAIARVDGYNYPNFRTWTFGFELNF